jgi:hypothetical protein
MVDHISLSLEAVDSCPNRVLCTRRKFNIEAQTCFCIFLPAAIAAARKFKPPASRVVVDSIKTKLVSDIRVSAEPAVFFQRTPSFRREAQTGILYA